MTEAAARKRDVNQVRAEGRAAKAAGKSVYSNPYPTHDMNRYQWIKGYMEEWAKGGGDDYD